MALKNGRSKAAVQAILVGSIIPPGTITPFGGGTVPTGWLLCDGSQVSRTTFADLFLSVGTAHGIGNGSSTFHLPDYRGRFLRGSDNMGTGAAGRDPDAGSRTAANTGGATANANGSVQGHAFQTHTHAQDDHNHTQNAHAHTIQWTTASGTSGKIGSSFQSNGAVAFNGVDQAVSNTATNIANTATNQNAAASGGQSQASTGESRPQNVNTNYIIKV